MKGFKVGPHFLGLIFKLKPNLELVEFTWSPMITGPTSGLNLKTIKIRGGTKAPLI